MLLQPCPCAAGRCQGAAIKQAASQLGRASRDTSKWFIQFPAAAWLSARDSICPGAHPRSGSARVCWFNSLCPRCQCCPGCKGARMCWLHPSAREAV